MIPETPITREEHYLAKIAGEDVETPTPITRKEQYWDVIAGSNGIAPDPITRIEYYLAKIAGMDVSIPAPVTRMEIYLAKIAGEDIEVPEPITRVEYYLAEWAEGSSAVLKTVSGTNLQITDALARTAYQLKVTIVPKQESGTPSPSNILPITGWTGCDIFHTRGNIIDAGYSAHQGETISVNWESEAGTVYGGTLTINEDGSADLERDSALKTARGTYSTWESFGSGSSKYYRYKLSSDTNYITNRSSAICTHFARTTISASTTDIGFQIQIVSSGTSAQKGTWIAFRPDLSVYDTLTKFKNYVEEQYENGTPVQYFVYYTDVRATTHFDNIGQLQLFRGENNIWVEGTHVGTSNKVGTGMADYMTLTQ